MPSHILWLSVTLLLSAQVSAAQLVSRTVLLNATAAPSQPNRDRWALSLEAENGRSKLWLDLPLDPRPGQAVSLTLTADRTTKFAPLTWALLQAAGIGNVGAEVGSEDSLTWQATCEGRGLSWRADPPQAAVPYSAEPAGSWEVYTVAVVPEGDPLEMPIPLVLGLNRSAGQAALFQPTLDGPEMLKTAGPVILAFTLASLWRVRE
jgi:hypothetical protein